MFIINHMNKINIVGRSFAINKRNDNRIDSRVIYKKK